MAHFSILFVLSEIEMNMIAAAYARVSTQRQENEETIENQLMVIKEYAEKNGHTLVKEYRDEGWSGTILARPSLDDLRLDAKKKLWEAIIVYDPDRIARKYSYQAWIIDELEELGVKVLFITTPPIMTEEDRLLYGVKGLFSEYERGRIADRFRLGKIRKAREGNVVTSSAPYGYDYIPKQNGRDGHYRINRQESLVVKMIFELIGNEGLTMRETIIKLKEMNIPPRKSKRGVWNTSTLTTLLRNETYIGRGYYYKSYGVVPQKPLKFEKYKKIKKTSRKMRPRSDWIEIKTPVIISKELFEKVRRQLKTNYELCKRNKKNQYLLSGKIYCTCGNRRTGEGPQRGKHLYYRCTDRVHSFPLPPNCKERAVNARVADWLLWKKLASFLSSPDLIINEANRLIKVNSQKADSREESTNELREQLDKIKKEEHKYIKLFGSEYITIEQLKEAMNDLKMRRTALEGQIENYKEKESNLVELPTAKQINEFVKRTRDGIQELGFESRQLIVRKLVDKIVANQKEMTVYGYLPLETEENIKYGSISRNCRFTKCREVYTF